MSSAVRNVPHVYDQKYEVVGVFGFDSRGDNTLNWNTQWLNDLLVRIIARYESGLPYTPIQVTNEATLGAYAPIGVDYTNSRRMPDRLNLDFYVERRIPLGSFEIAPFAVATNILDKKNVSEVWNGTGLPNSTGWLQTPEGQQFIQNTTTPDYTGLNGEDKYRIREQAPGHYYAPREFFVGVKGRF
jgi:hypothetical protein